MTTIEALIKSRDHWIEMRDNKNTEEKPIADHCALCQLFYNKGCNGCPISGKTGATYCRDSPYELADERFDTRLNSPKAWESWQEAANVMIQFLEKLINEYKTLGD